MEKYLSRDRYWFSLTTALYYGGINACLQILHDPAVKNHLPSQPRELFLTLMKRKPFLYSLLKHGILHLDEWDLLFPESELTDSCKFDLGTILALLQAICLQAPKGGWINPDPDDHGISYFVVKLRHFKDKLGGYKQIELINQRTYAELWDELTEVLHNLNFRVANLDELHISNKDEIVKFKIKKQHRKLFHSAFTRAKMLYIWKKMNDTKEFYTKHLNNVSTVMSVVKYTKIESIFEEAMEIKKLVLHLEAIYDKEQHHDFKKFSKTISEIENVYNEIAKNDKILDSVIFSHNIEIDQEDSKSSTGTRRKKKSTIGTLCK